MTREERRKYYGFLFCQKGEDTEEKGKSQKKYGRMYRGLSMAAFHRSHGTKKKEWLTKHDQKGHRLPFVFAIGPRDHKKGKNEARRGRKATTIDGVVQGTISTRQKRKRGGQGLGNQVLMCEARKRQRSRDEGRIPEKNKGEKRRKGGGYPKAGELHFMLDLKFWD